jgi:hypothetical protein
LRSDIDKAVNGKFVPPAPDIPEPEPVPEQPKPTESVPWYKRLRNWIGGTILGGSLGGGGVATGWGLAFVRHRGGCGRRGRPDPVCDRAMAVREGRRRRLGQKNGGCLMFGIGAIISALSTLGSAAIGAYNKTKDVSITALQTTASIAQSQVQAMSLWIGHPLSPPSIMCYGVAIWFFKATAMDKVIGARRSAIGGQPIRSAERQR